MVSRINPIGTLTIDPLSNQTVYFSLKKKSLFILIYFYVQIRGSIGEKIAKDFNSLSASTKNYIAKHQG